ncbi:hypothetical protein IEQ34_012975 [Dendrobium chrysotoxum]|uniref:Glycosyl transferase 48 domain-containing protein n=1 Tax=Dendrobium chrysotoxum TaxID=161865 RepID=A0AAV7GNA0_DENCH|nr:hypothetical protein IEQ34_012975 [Dendrobium chrysotoxum]
MGRAMGIESCEEDGRKEKKIESSISDTQASSKDKQIDKRKEVNEEGKEINLQSQANGIRKSTASNYMEQGEALQAIDVNQDNYWEEALKIRKLLEKFNEEHGLRPPTILGVRGHIFTGSISTLGWFMSNQETSFKTIGQRVLATPLKVCFQYRHPDASRGINLSEDIFARFNSTLRQRNITHYEYIPVGKGGDVGLNQISLFEANVTNRNGEQILSRDIYHLDHRFDFFCMLSHYFTTIGFYVSSMIFVIVVHLFLYGKPYLSLSGLKSAFIKQTLMRGNNPLKAAMASQSVVQLGLLMALPMVIEIGLKRGFKTALSNIIIMQVQLYLVFFTFLLGTKSNYFGRTIVRPKQNIELLDEDSLGDKFAENYKMYSRSHFIKGLELMLPLIVYQIYGYAPTNSTTFMLLTASMWFLVVT